MAQEIETTSTEDVPDGATKELERRLSVSRAWAGLKRDHRVLSLQARVQHQLAVSGERAKARRDRRQRREENRDASEETALNGLRRRASVSGERARTRARIQQSAEMRALRVSRVRTTSLMVLLPVLVAFAAWSTAGVHAGLTLLLAIEAGSPMWWAAWGLEPALITIVGGLIIVRAVLRSSGGDLGLRATLAEWGALTVSIALNAAGHWPDGGSLTAVVALIAHSIGPLGAALTAWLIGIIDDAVATARPDRDRNGERVPSLADLEATERAERAPVTTVEEVERPSEREAITQVTAGERREELSEADYERLLSGSQDEDAPTEPAADERPARPVSGSVGERRAIVARLLADDPEMTGPAIAQALTDAGFPVSVPTAKRDRAAVTGE
ncbi:hypothetical protein [Nocardiopsis lucentensis]|uniref:hypothetical protein n=1 Tax=Nocardiopsis lucentensis TaxID=53441 RepID=UPI00034DA048|nr:hypothetical protein [Nocardiopsis lucentensis]